MNPKIKGLTSKEKLAIEEYKNLLIKKFPRRLKKIILYGSKARGNSRRSSDVDLLVVLTGNGKRTREEVVNLTHQPIVRFEVLLSPITVEEKFLSRWSPLLNHIKKEGITLWTKPRKNISV